MKYLWIIPVAALTGCDTTSPYADFNLSAVDSAATCKILSDGPKPMVMPWKPEAVFAVGDACPSTLPNDPGIHIYKRDIKIGDKNRFVVVVSSPDTKTGFSQKIVIRQNDSSYRGNIGQYKTFYTKIKLPAPQTPGLTPILSPQHASATPPKAT
jgi:hypothetical protein